MLDNFFKLEEELYTINISSEAIFKDKSSKFISYIYPINSEKQILDLIQKIKKEHPQARHFCYAWRIGIENQKFKINDDGEPNGTAGKPIYNQLLSNKLSNILIVVVRYFGGTLLGKSGLINAYKTATKLAINNSEIIILEEKINFKLNFDYKFLNDVMKILKEINAQILYINKDEIVEIELFSLKKEWNKVKNLLGSMCNIKEI